MVKEEEDVFEHLAKTARLIPPQYLSAVDGQVRQNWGMMELYSTQCVSSPYKGPQ